MRTLTITCLIAIALAGCAAKLPAPSASDQTPSQSLPAAQGDIERQCAEIRKETTDLYEGAEGVPAYSTTDPEALSFEEEALKKENELAARAASLQCPATSGTPTLAAKQPAATQPVSQLVPLTFDQCFERCRQLTDRSKDQCFDACKK